MGNVCMSGNRVEQIVHETSPESFVDQQVEHSYAMDEETYAAYQNLEKTHEVAHELLIRCRQYVVLYNGPRIKPLQRSYMALYDMTSAVFLALEHYRTRPTFPQTIESFHALLSRRITEFNRAEQLSLEPKWV